MKLNVWIGVIVTWVMSMATAFAADAPPQSASGAFLQTLPMMILLIFVFYFLLIRPQSKRAKEHKSLLNDLSIGDEVVTTGGILARIIRIKEDFLHVKIGKDVEIMIQKQSIHSVLPKGTIDSID